MKVHFITSRPTLQNDIEVLRQVVKIVKASGNTIALDWIEEAYGLLQEQKPGGDWKDIYRRNLAAIAQADVVMAETSHENFAVGYQVAVAVQQKKPVLLVRHKQAEKNAFATGVEDGWVKHAEYDGENLQTIIESFLEENSIQSKDMRFNFFIDRKIYNYLRWAAFKTGKTKAEILRELVQREIEKKDY